MSSALLCVLKKVFRTYLERSKEVGSPGGAAPPARAAKTEKIGENLPRAASRSAQNLTRVGQEAARRPPKSAPAPAFEHRKRRIEKNSLKSVISSRHVNIWTPILEQHESNLGSKMEPESAQNHKKIDAKIDRKINASWE